MELKYYRTFVSYRIPFEPEGVLLYSETEGLDSYYIGYHDAAGRLVQFVKILLERADEKGVAVAATGTPGARVYFRAQSSTAQPSVGDQIDYAETEANTDFHIGTIQPSGLEAILWRTRKQQEFRDFYVYGLKGRLRLRLLMRRDSPFSAWIFDESGVPHPTGVGQSGLADLGTLRPAAFSVEMKGRNAKEACRDLQTQLKIEGIPQEAVTLEVIGSATRLGVALAPVLAPLLVETIYRWLTTPERRDLSVQVVAHDKTATVDARHFDRQELVGLIE